MAQVTGRTTAGPRETGAIRARTEAWLLDLVHTRRLSPTQRRVVQTMLDSMPDVAFMSTVDVAELAGVSQPTVVRLASALGFAGYPEFRAAVRRLALSAVEPVDVPERRSALVTALAAEQSNIAAWSGRWTITGRYVPWRRWRGRTRSGFLGSGPRRHWPSTWVTSPPGSFRASGC